jgi:hypothetical protein
VSSETVAAESARGPLGFVALALASAVSLGLLVITATVLVVDSLRSGNQPGNLDLSFYLLVGDLLVGGTLLGVLGAAQAAWRLLAPVGSVYRRGGLSIVSAFATVLLMLVCIPVNELFGRSGLSLLLAASAALAFVTSRYARRWGTGT